MLGVAGWNVKQAVTRSFADDLDFSRVEAARKPLVCRVGTAGYLGRAAAFGLIGWFLIDAGRQHDPSESRGLDASLRELTTAPFGPTLLLVVAAGLVAFGLQSVSHAGRFGEKTPQEQRSRNNHEEDQHLGHQLHHLR